MDAPEGDEDREWQELATAEFLKGYVESDAIYDESLLRSHVESQKPNVEQSRSDNEHNE